MKNFLLIFLTLIVIGCNENRSHKNENKSNIKEIKFVSEKSSDYSESTINENSSFNDSITTEKNDTIIQEFTSIKDSISLNIIKNDILKMSENDFDEFEKFIKKFIDEILYNDKDRDYLIYNNDSIFQKYINDTVGFYFTYNMGVFCDLYSPMDYYEMFDLIPEKTNHFLKTPKQSIFYKNQLPIIDCEDSESPDGIYYKQISEIDLYIDHYGDGTNKEPEIIKNSYKILVSIISNAKASSYMYFIKKNNNWFIHILNRCDCGA